jgi:hypothetical protein
MDLSVQLPQFCIAREDAYSRMGNAQIDIAVAVSDYFLRRMSHPSF